MNIRKLRSVRLVLIVIAVILSLAIVGVRMLWMPSEQVPQEPVQETGSTNTQPAQTVPVQTQATEAPTEEATEATVATEPEASSEEESDGEEENGKPTLPFPGTDNSGDKSNEGSLENSLGEMQPNGEELEEAGDTDLPPQNESGDTDDSSQGESDDVLEVSAEYTAQSTGGNQTAVISETENQSDSKAIQVQASTKGKDVATAVFYILWGMLAADIVAIIVLTVMIHQENKKSRGEKRENTVRIVSGQEPAGQVPTQIRVGQLHNIGARPYQEDSSGVSMLEDGVLAIVADGMGGLSGGDRVSQKIVYTMLGYSDQLRPGMMDGVLERMVYGANEVVNNMLGPEGLYKSGSTLLAVLVRNNRFHWITVGDSHIYYFHNGHLKQLNEEHNRGQELLNMAARGEITYEEARNAPKKNGLTSFIGMGRLKYIDKSQESIPLVAGDRILLVTDGVFNALSDQTIEAVLTRIPDVQQAAAELERLVIQRANPRQDNFTAVILGF